MNPRPTPLTTCISTTTAVTASLFALQHNTEAAVIYSTGPSQSISISSNFRGFKALLVPNLPGASMYLRLQRSYQPQNQTTRGGAVLINPNGEVFEDSFGLRKFGFGDRISAAQYGSGGAPLRLNFGKTILGNWGNGETALAGFQLPGGELGWIRLGWSSTDASGLPDTMTLVDYAYDETPNEAMLAGEGADVPEPNTAALLALAGGGVAALRRRRKAAAI
jgi:hypothetical protein